MPPEFQDMERDSYSGHGNEPRLDTIVLQNFEKSFGQVQILLDQNKLLINEINRNHESRNPENLSRNVGLIRELNNNIRRVVDLYADLSRSFAKSSGPSSEGDSSGVLRSSGGKTALKRNRLS